MNHDYLSSKLSGTKSWRLPLKLCRVDTQACTLYTLVTSTIKSNLSISTFLEWYTNEIAQHCIVCRSQFGIVNHKITFLKC